MHFMILSRINIKINVEGLASPNQIRKAESVKYNFTQKTFSVLQL